MPERPCYIVDASIATKWYLNDEDGAETAAVLFQEFDRGNVELYAPEQIRYEVPSAIRQAVSRTRLSPEHGRQATELFLSLDFTTVRSTSLTILAYDQALRWGCSLYDGLYLALAEATDYPLVFADHRLKNTLAGRFPLAVWIDDYSP